MNRFTILAYENAQAKVIKSILWWKSHGIPANSVSFLMIFKPVKTEKNLIPEVGKFKLSPYPYPLKFLDFNLNMIDIDLFILFIE